jgi:hypothetical protein
VWITHAFIRPRILPFLGYNGRIMTFSRRSVTVATAVIIGAIIIAGVTIWRAQTPQSTVLTAAEVRTLLLQHTRIPIPPVATSTVIAVRQLPSFMQILVMPQATRTVARAIMYEGSKRGYGISYADPEAIENAYIAFTESVGREGWSPTRGERSDLFAYFEFSGNGLNARAEFTAAPASSTFVVVSVVQQ